MNLLDIMIIVVLAVFLISGMYRGMFTSGLSTVGFLGAWYGAGRLYERVANMALSNSTLMAVLNQYLEPESFFANHTQAMTNVADVVAGGESAIQSAVSSIGENLAIVADAFEFNVRSQMFQNLGISTLSDYLDQTIWQAVFNVGAFILCFVALYALISLVVNLLDHVICWPVFLGGAIDSLLGGLLGLVRGVVLVVLILSLLPSLINVVSPEFAQDLLAGSTLYSTVSQMDFLGINALIQGLIGG